MIKILFGYEIKNGVVIINEKNANMIRNLYELCAKGISMRECVKQCKAPFHPITAKRYLQNPDYMGTEIYKSIISKEIFIKANNIIRQRAKSIDKRPRSILKPCMHFNMKKIKKVYDNPFVMAQYKYSLIDEVME